MKKRDLDTLYRAFGGLVRYSRKQLPDRMSQERLGRLVGLSRTSITDSPESEAPLLGQKPSARFPFDRMLRFDRGYSGKMYQLQERLNKSQHTSP
jgi:hypothetical protein